MARQPLLDHPNLTTLGLLFETHAGLTRRFERELMAASGLSLQWFEVLLRLARSPGHRLRMSDLAAQTTLTASGLTRAVDRLEDAGLVTRETCPSDRRGAFAVLTDAGQQRIEAAVPIHLAQAESLLAGALAPTELEALTAALRRLRDVVNPDAATASMCGLIEAEADARSTTSRQ